MRASRPRRLPLGWMGAERGWVGFWKEPAEELTVFEFSGELLSSRLKFLRKNMSLEKDCFYLGHCRYLKLLVDGVST